MFALAAGSLVLSDDRVGAQTPVCSGLAFGTASGTRACDGAASPVSVSATVRTYARLALDDVFGAPATALRFAMGDVDAACVSAPAAGVTCMADHGAGAATWYGDVRFRVKVSGIAGSRVKLVGARPTSGTIPPGRLLDGGAGSAPTSVYPVASTTGTELQTGIGNGETVVARSLGLRVHATDPAGTWAGDTVFSLVLE